MRMLINAMLHGMIFLFMGSMILGLILWAFLVVVGAKKVIDDTTNTYTGIFYDISKQFNDERR